MGVTQIDYHKNLVKITETPVIKILFSKDKGPDTIDYHKNLVKITETPVIKILFSKDKGSDLS